MERFRLAYNSPIAMKSIKYVREWYVLSNASIRHFVTLFLLYINFKNLSIRQFVITMLGREIRVGLVVFVNLSICQFDIRLM